MKISADRNDLFTVIELEIELRASLEKEDRKSTENVNDNLHWSGKCIGCFEQSVYVIYT